MKNKTIPLCMLALVISGCGSDNNNESAKAVENASVCFNEDLYKVGATIVMEGQHENGLTKTATIKILETTDFRGQEAILRQTTTDDEVSNDYLTIDSGNKVITDLGRRESSNAPSAVSYYTPGFITAFDMNKGDVNEQTVTSIAEFMDGTQYETVVNYKLTFEGIESVTLSSGTYKACKFNYDYEYTMNFGEKETLNSSYNIWFAVDHGVVLQTESINEQGSSSKESVESISIDGVKI